MRGLQKSKRVSWASDVNLCQVKLFLSEESPSLIGLGAQDYLHAKSSWPSNSAGAGSDDNLPPGFEGTHPANVLHNKLSQIPVIQWKCPPRFVFDPSWQVVGGDESNEVECQNQREMRVLEAVYPRPSAIPPNPSMLISVDDSHDNDQHTHLIPITPIEDDDASVDTLFDNVPSNTAPMSLSAQLSSPGIPAFQSSATSNPSSPANFVAPAATALGVEPDIVTAAYTALSAVMATNDQGNLIDPDLLVKILRDPQLMEKLGSSHGARTNPQIMPKPRLQGITLPDPPLAHINRSEAVALSLAAIPCRPFYPPAGREGPTPNIRPPPPEVVLASPPPIPPPLGAPVAKDINYYKSLIQQHGGERQETLSQFGNRHHQLGPSWEPTSYPKSRDLKPKTMKPCIYFNSSRGCRHGANCAYQHDVSSQQRVNSIPEVQSAKRMKMDREITGT